MYAYFGVMYDFLETVTDSENVNEQMTLGISEMKENGKPSQDQISQGMVNHL